LPTRVCFRGYIYPSKKPYPPPKMISFPLPRYDKMRYWCPNFCLFLSLFHFFSLLTPSLFFSFPYFIFFPSKNDRPYSPPPPGGKGEGYFPKYTLLMRLTGRTNQIRLQRYINFCYQLKLSYFVIIIRKEDVFFEISIRYF
jgi:hypothetical protein